MSSKGIANCRMLSLFESRDANKNLFISSPALPNLLSPSSSSPKHTCIHAHTATATRHDGRWAAKLFDCTEKVGAWRPEPKHAGRTSRFGTATVLPWRYAAARPRTWWSRFDAWRSGRWWTWARRARFDAWRSRAWWTRLDAWWSWWSWLSTWTWICSWPWLCAWTWQRKGTSCTESILPA